MMSISSIVWLEPHVTSIILISAAFARSHLRVGEAPSAQPNYLGRSPTRWYGRDGFRPRHTVEGTYVY